jgi:hypothetical protein
VIPIPCSTSGFKYLLKKLDRMENIPQPSNKPYAPGDRVRIYISDKDLDAQYHGLVCEVVEDNPDDLDELSGRKLDRHHYLLRQVETGDTLPLQFRHADLVPASKWPKRE